MDDGHPLMLSRAIWLMEQTESLFYPMKVDFVFSGASYYDDQFRCHLETRNVLTIYTPDTYSGNAGYGTFPWQGPPSMIIYNLYERDPSDFAHEIGHNLFLYHAFAEDGVDDTPVNLNDSFGHLSNNIMCYPYVQWYFQRFTAGQINRMKFELTLPARKGLVSP